MRWYVFTVDNQTHSAQTYPLTETDQTSSSDSTDAITPATRALAYGDGFFTTMGVYQKYILWQTYHDARLKNHANALDIHLTANTCKLLWQSLNTFAEHIEHGVIKLIISRPTQSLSGYAYSTDPIRNNAKIWIGIALSAPLADKSAKFLSPSYMCLDDKSKTSENQTNCSNSLILQQPPITAICLTSKLASLPIPIAGLKTLNRLDSVLIAGELQRYKDTPNQEADSALSPLAEGLVQDMTGNWVEGVMSNVFYQLKGQVGQWFTPPLKHSGVKGVMRQVIMDRLTNTDCPVILRPLITEDLASLQALFFCNAVRGVMPVEALRVEGQVIDLDLSVFNTLNFVDI